MILRLVGVGVLSILGQVVLLRELSVTFFGGELVYILAFGVWLFGTATGAISGRASRVPTQRAVSRIFFLYGWILLVALLITRRLRILLGTIPGGYPSFPRQVAGMALALVPVALLAGLLFQWVAKRFVDRGGTLARAYAFESAGALVGGGMATLGLHWGLQNLSLALFCCLLSLLGAWPARGSREPTGLAGAVAASLLLMAGALALAGPVDRATTRWNHPDVIGSRDSPYGRITLTERAGQVTVFHNDALAFETQGTAAEELVHVAALQRQQLRAVLVLGGGGEGVLAEVLKHRPVRIDYVEVNPVLLELLDAHLPDDLRRGFASPAVNVVVADPRRFLDQAGVYDLILVGMPEPESAEANRFYTREFFRRCATRLTAKGVIALRLRGAENLWTPQLARRAASIYRALDLEFADVVVLPGTTNVLLGSAAPLTREPHELSARLAERGIEARLVVPQYLLYLYTNDRFAEIAATLASTEAPTNSDLRPVCYQYTLLIWLSRFYLDLALLDLPRIDPRGGLDEPAGWLVAALLVGALLVARRRDLLRRSLLAASAGFVGMVLEVVLILHYQTHSGVLYQDLGLLLTLFMAGLALGSWAVDAWAQKFHASDRWPRGIGVLIVLGLASCSLAVHWLMVTGRGRGLAPVSVLLLLCGFWVAALFAYASLRRRPDQVAVVGPLYAADLAGGCVASLVASLFLIPMIGIAGSTMAVVLATGAALLLV